jgi:hypothetical protein
MWANWQSLLARLMASMSPATFWTTRSPAIAWNFSAIEAGAQFDFNTVGNKKLTIGKIFTAISNTAASSINGTFANLADESTVTVGVNKLQVSYSGGDGNDLTLTVAQESTPVFSGADCLTDTTNLARL